MATDMDERYATFREHAELRERTATLEATMLQISPTLARIETMVAQRAQTPDHGALALHHAAEAMDRFKGGNNGTSPLLNIFAILGAIAIGALAMKLVGF